MNGSGRFSIARRAVAVALGLAMLGTASLLGDGSAAAQQQKAVKIGVIVPLSGAWARQGQLVKMGAETAVAEINAGGGIKALRGAKLELVTLDAGDTPEKARNAAQRLIAQEPDVVGGMGSWLSSFTLAVTEVTERAELPWFTLSYADSITGRGFKYVFQTSPPGGAQSSLAMPTIVEIGKSATGAAPKSAGMIGDNTASPISFLKPMREGGLEKLGMKVVVDETFTPPLSDATPLVQKIRSSRPEFLVFVTTTISDLKLSLEKLNEFKLARGAIPIVANGAHMGAPEVLKNVPADLIEGVMFIVANWPLKGHEKINEMFTKATGEPWITQDGLAGYGQTWILKEALERAGVADKGKVAEQVRKLDLKEGPAAVAFPGGVKFDEAGRRVGAQVVIAQWQGGKPLSVYPLDRALAKPIWPKK
ncbi:MAG TPA: ABC transporter substrate-binding protein [Hyphomicrobiaceae bacterium]|jgi:branched-chain amino acid transport system substrate-binding protein|nr:ABC transporter substrate-binding protein [Hyphomicrobiaceae bacterium]